MSRVTREARYQMTKDGGLVLLYEDTYEYSGPVAECKGDDVAKKQMEEQNKLQKDAYDLMKQRQNEVNSAVGKYMTGDIGYDPAQLALLRSQLLNQLALSYDQAGANARTALARNGSDTIDGPVGGDYVRGIAALEGGLASDRAAGLANIDLDNLKTALTNKFNAASLINGQAASLSFPIGSFGQGASSALDSFIEAKNAPGFLNSLTTTLGKGLGTMATGGIGNLFNKIPGMAKQ